MNVLLTGSNGFVGRRLAESLAGDTRIELASVVRTPASAPYGRECLVNNLDGQTDWHSLLANQHVVIHAAARAHVMRYEMADSLPEYRRVNVDGTLNLAKESVKAGVKRFIYISSIKVNGEQTLAGTAFSAADPPHPEDAYGISKLEAEQGLQSLAAKTGLELVIIRPALVYGREVKGNFASLVKLVDKGIPLPLGAIHNRRSLVALDNLVDLILTCIDHPAAANQVFLAADGEDLSTSDLIRRLAAAMGKSARLLPVPAAMLQIGATLLGKKALAQRLLGSLQVDISQTQGILGWKPPLSVDEGLERCFTESRDV